LTLQEGCPVILLRNMPGGLVNGTRLIVVKLMHHIIDVEIATGPDKGRHVFIPCLSVIPFDTERMPFTLRRRQFLLRPAFAMTINKAQGQTLQTVGVYLPKPVFCHWQLYVAFSPVRLTVGRPSAGPGWQQGGSEWGPCWRLH
jgi:hypothetical protein